MQAPITNMTFTGSKALIDVYSSVRGSDLGLTPVQGKISDKNYDDLRAFIRSYLRDTYEKIDLGATKYIDMALTRYDPDTNYGSLGIYNHADIKSVQPKLRNALVAKGFIEGMVIALYSRQPKVDQLMDALAQLRQIADRQTDEIQTLRSDLVTARSRIGELSQQLSLSQERVETLRAHPQTIIQAQHNQGAAESLKDLLRDNPGKIATGVIGASVVLPFVLAYFSRSKESQ